MADHVEVLLSKGMENCYAQTLAGDSCAGSAVGWTMRSSEAAYLLLFLPVYIQKEAKQSPLAQETNPFLHPGLGWGLSLAFITKFKPLKAYPYSSLSWDFWDPGGAVMQR